MIRVYSAAGPPRAVRPPGIEFVPLLERPPGSLDPIYVCANAAGPFTPRCRYDGFRQAFSLRWRRYAPCLAPIWIGSVETPAQLRGRPMGALAGVAGFHAIDLFDARWPIEAPPLDGTQWLQARRAMLDAYPDAATGEIRVQLHKMENLHAGLNHTWNYLRFHGSGENAARARETIAAEAPGAHCAALALEIADIGTAPDTAGEIQPLGEAVVASERAAASGDAERLADLVAALGGFLRRARVCFPERR